MTPDSTIVHYRHTLRLKRYNCGCVRGRADYAQDCDAMLMLHRNQDIIGMVKHLADGVFEVIEANLTSTWDSADNSRIGGAEESAEQMRKRMIGR